MDAREYPVIQLTNEKDFDFIVEKFEKYKIDYDVVKDFGGFEIAVLGYSLPLEQYLLSVGDLGIKTELVFRYYDDHNQWWESEETYNNTPSSKQSDLKDYYNSRI
jgi:hypothetical protein